jgi:glycerophosphoryl diester phosphodiesterase
LPSAPLWAAFSRPFAVAHRFGNDLAKIDQATEAGAEVIEADIWLHLGRLEVRHSKTMWRVPLLWDRWSLHAGWRPRLFLERLLELVPPDRELMLDIKGYRRSDPRIAEYVTLTHRRYRPGRPFLISGQNWRLLDAFRQFPEAVIVHSIGSRQQLDRSWGQLERPGFDAVSIQYTLLDSATVSRLKERVGLVVTWAINTEERLSNALEWGVDGVITDSPAIMRRVRSAGNPRS